MTDPNAKRIRTFEFDTNQGRAVKTDEHVIQPIAPLAIQPKREPTLAEKLIQQQADLFEETADNGE